MSWQHHFDCGNHVGPVADHYPLSREGVRELLMIARSSSDWREQNSIQIRLDQGIPGLQCPRQIDGPVGYALGAIDDFYVNRFIRGLVSDNEAADRIVSIYQGVRGGVQRAIIGGIEQ